MSKSQTQLSQKSKFKLGKSKKSQIEVLARKSQKFKFLKAKNC